MLRRESGVLVTGGRVGGGGRGWERVGGGGREKQGEQAA